jgi:PhnB protein
MRVSTNLSFDGGCAEAFALYARVLGGTVTFALRYADSPMAGDVPSSWGDKIVHTTLSLPDGTTLFGSDAPPGTYEPPGGFSLTIAPRDVVAARTAFEALAAGGRVTQPLEATFWAAAFGTLIDRFGVPWAINCEAPKA